MCGFVLHKSHDMLNYELCVSIDVRLFWVQVFACQMSKIHIDCTYVYILLFCERS